MTNDYIRREDTKDALQEKVFHNLTDEFYGAMQVLDELEPADVAPVVHGRWLPIVSYNNTYKCSECGRLLVDITDGLKMVAKHYPYCHCGAKMDGGKLNG
jgi:DNA-directed RNA polymerase subunit RPC12/RpoP